MKIRDAVSLFIVSSGKVFVIKRQNYLKSFPGYTAFAGGKIDPEDKDHYDAIYREGMEELSFDFKNDKRVKGIKQVAVATSPEFNPYRFKTFFYRIDLSETIDFKFDSGEFVEAKWMEPSEVIQQWNEGQIICVPPVRIMIEELVKNFNYENVDFPKRYNLDIHVPHVESIKGLWQVMPLSDTVPPADRTNSFIFGENPRVMVDPSPRDDDEIKKFLHTLKDESVDLIFLTHHHPDHHRNLDKILLKLKLPVTMSEDTYKRIVHKKGKDYFLNTQIKFIKDRDVLTKWLSKEVICHAIPGHDEGHLGLAPSTLEWFIVGDLFQGVGTVVIGGEEANMSKYFHTLEKVIAMKPNCVIPSHGIALGGTFILEKTLEHRKMREGQVLEMHNEGLSVSEMLKRIYFNIPEKLFVYAEANIHSHLDKLREEGKLD